MKIKNRLALIILAILLQMAWIAAPAESATFTVTSAADTGPGTLRWAIEQANASPGADEIFFDDDYIIYPITLLPPLTDNSGATIDGADHTVIIDGSQLVYGLWLVYGLKLASDHNIIQHLQVRNTVGWEGAVGGGGIWIMGSYNLVYGCRIYGNGFAGITLGAWSGTKTVGYNKIQSCMIGTSDGVTTGQGHKNGGIYGFSGVVHTIVGVDGDGVNDANEGNLISGNNGAGGIFLRNSTDTVIAGNLIGTDLSGTLSLPNTGGAAINGAGTNAIIGTNGDGISDELERNIISGNMTSAVYLNSGSRFSGNYVGVDITGTKALANSGRGVSLYTMNSALIGTDGNGVSDELERNIISGNTGDGISAPGASGTSLNNVRIAGNFIGTDVTGMLGIGNGGTGINLYQPYFGTDGVFIGTDSSGGNDSIEANVISANGGSGISIFSPTGYQYKPGTLRISGNFIGTNKTGTAALLNQSVGRAIYFTGTSINNIVGTNGDGINDAAEGNIIVGGLSLGYYISYMPKPAPSYNNIIAGNNLGVDATGTKMLGGVGAAALSLTNAQHNVIGTNGDGVSDELEGNVIADGSGFNISGVHDSRISGNYVGLAADGHTILGYGSTGAVSYGLIIQISHNNIIGTDGDGISDDLESNVFVANANGAKGDGISLNGSNYNVVAGNLIGTNPEGNMSSGFGRAGISVAYNGNGNIIGTNWDGVSDALEANVIANNGYTFMHSTTGYDGVAISGGNYNAIRGNSMFNNAGQGINLLNGANLGIAAPAIVTVSHDGNSYVVSGTAPVDSMVEIFIADASTVDGGGEGKIYLDRVLATNGTFTFHLNNIGVDDYLTATATDVNGNTSEFSQTRDFTGHLPPVVNSIADQTVDTGSLLAFAVTATSPHGLPVVITTTELPTGASFDGTSFSWTPEFNQAGLTDITFVANDGQSTTAKTVTITINAVNSPPVLAITGGGVFNLQDVIVLGAEVSDADGDQLTYSWSEGATILCSGIMTTYYGGAPVNLPNCQLPAGQALGAHIYGLEINDGYNLPVTGTVAATVQDSSAPTLAPTVDRTLLWPPNHEMVNVLITSNAKDDSGCLSLDVEVSSNEPENGMADGDNFPDFSEPLIDPQTGIVSLQLRAERDGRGNGRIYQVAIIATDCAGNSSTTTLEVLCPHDKKNYSNE